VFVWAQILILFGGLWLPLALHFKSIDVPFVRRSLLVLPVFFLGMSLVGAL